MENLDFISSLLNERIMLGKKEEITENLSIVPIYKIKINFFNVNTDIKNTIGDGNNLNFSVIPICILQIKNDNITVLKFDDKNSKEDFFDIIPSLVSNMNIHDILKGIKI